MKDFFKEDVDVELKGTLGVFPPRFLRGPVQRRLREMLGHVLTVGLSSPF